LPGSRPGSAPTRPRAFAAIARPTCTRTLNRKWAIYSIISHVSEISAA
jgi:hypothetical protein